MAARIAVYAFLGRTSWWITLPAAVGMATLILGAAEAGNVISDRLLDAHAAAQRLRVTKLRCAVNGKEGSLEAIIWNPTAEPADPTTIFTHVDLQTPNFASQYLLDWNVENDAGLGPGSVNLYKAIWEQNPVLKLENQFDINTCNLVHYGPFLSEGQGFDSDKGELIRGQLHPKAPN